MFVTRARICKPFKEPRNQFPAWWAGVRQPYLTYRPARLHRLAESIPGFLKHLQIRALVSGKKRIKHTKYKNSAITTSVRDISTLNSKVLDTWMCITMIIGHLPSATETVTPFFLSAATFSKKLLSTSAHVSWGVITYLHNKESLLSNTLIGRQNNCAKFIGSNESFSCVSWMPCRNRGG